MQSVAQRRTDARFNDRRTIPINFHLASRSARRAARMDCRLSLTGSMRKPSRVRTGFTKGTSFSTNSTTRMLPSAWREASKAVRGGNNSAEQIRPFLSATNFTMGLSHKQLPFQERLVTPSPHFPGRRRQLNRHPTSGECNSRRGWRTRR